MKTESVTEQLEHLVTIVFGAGIDMTSLGTSLEFESLNGDTPSAINDFYTGRRIAFTEGPLTGSSYPILKYDGASRRVFVPHMALIPAPGATAILL